MILVHSNVTALLKGPAECGVATSAIVEASLYSMTIIVALAEIDSGD